MSTKEEAERQMKQIMGERRKNPNLTRHSNFRGSNNDCEDKLKKYREVLADAEIIIDGMYRFSAPRSEVFKKEWMEMEHKARDWLETWMERLK